MPESFQALGYKTGLKGLYPVGPSFFDNSCNIELLFNISDKY